MNESELDHGHLEQVIREAITQRLERGSELLSVRVAQMSRAGKLSGSGEVAGAVDLVYKGSSNVMPERLWMKTADNPDEAFQVISSAFEKLVAAGLEATAPSPIALDVKNGVVITKT